MQVNTISRKLPLSLNPYQVYAALTDKGRVEHTALLETAEAGTHEHRRSVTMLSAALQIRALDQKVTLKALNHNGHEILASIKSSEEIANQFELRYEGGDLVHLICPEAVEVNNEQERLFEVTTISALQLIRDLLKVGQVSDDETSLLIGAFSYELVEQFEDLPDVEKFQEDYCFYVADQIIVQNQDGQNAKIVVKGFGENAENTVRLGVELEATYSTLKEASVSEVLDFSPQQENAELSLNLSDKDYYGFVEAAKERIKQGDIFQVVLSRKFGISCPNPFQAYGKLRQSNPSPYMYFVNFGDKQLFGASPESALKVNKQREVFLYPIAGTRKRAIDKNTGQINHEHDSRVEFELVEDAKENAEHMMLVDLARNDLAKVVQSGTREIIQLKKVIKYSHVQHMVSEIKGVLKPEIDSLVAYRACANMGTLTGAPKIKAMEIIRQQEKLARGFYGGAICMMNANDEFDSAIIIRSAVVSDGQAMISAGAGIVHDSEPKAEALETVNKAKAVIDACRQQLPQSEVLA
ncbi:anthranilate synthase component 1 [Kangiella shandongensis]|uniref:anthranilate synthase component 1 n=1 Tax=Kangiella shandongensis TaxID=2763258 RepID=UPI001CC10675|nr:anthranilate synthase component 1 [Kangiella shandongensis]